MHFFGSGKIFRSGAAGRNFGPPTFTNYLKHMVRTPHGFCCAAGLGNEKLAKSIFWYYFYENPNPGATFFVYVKLLISLLNGALFRLGEIFSVRGYGARFLAGKNCASDEKVFSGIFFTKTRTPGPHFLFM